MSDAHDTGPVVNAIAPAPPIGFALVGWFVQNQRPLPWRRHYDPYAVWISEVMLQQTQMSKVLPYYERWMARFPTVQAVAKASLEELLRAWEGLGYYGRVRQLQKAAQEIVTLYGGNIPWEEEALRRLPGIGPYTAAAVASLAFGRDVPVLDGNAQRVSARLLDWPKPVKDAESQRILRQVLEEWMPSGRAREFNQAVMELGSLICKPKKPRCTQCPVRAWCRAYAADTVAHRPVAPRRPLMQAITVAVGVLCDNGKVFIQKRPPQGLMAGLWEFPGGKAHEGETPEETLHRELAEELGVTVTITGKITEIRHAITRYRLHLHAFRCVLNPPDQPLELRSAVQGLWVPLDGLDQYAFPSANRRLIRMLQTRQGTTP
ncbi:A/G-specific adenine glycosylase [Desulfosoma sp.]|uniref:A/G-specific adenine glycosylase n=1 Tax=Desulfosoma sp. TaxID=2603217 RepID=UPI00404B7A28